MNRHLIKEMRQALEYTYFVEEVTDDYILVSLLESDPDKPICYFKVFGIKCPDCGSFLLFDMDKDNCICSNNECLYHKFIAKA